jgi:dipeptidyl aminopeptidase/acylaminoacyl peptidase
MRPSVLRHSLPFLLCMVVTTAMGQQPPLVDRDIFFGDPEISGAQISPDGKYIAFLKPLEKTRNVWVKKTEEAFDKAKPVTNDQKRPIGGYFWSRDGKYILFVQDQAGNENYNVYAVNPADAPAAGSPVPAARNLTDVKGVRAMIYAVPKSDPNSIYVGLNDRDKAWHDLYKVNIATGERALLRRNTDRITGWVFDNKDQVRLASRSAENGDTEVLRIDEGNKFALVYSCNVFETCAPVKFHLDNQRVYMMTNKGDSTDLIGLALFDPASRKMEMVETDPQGKVDLTQPIFSDLTDKLIGTAYIYDKLKINWQDPAYKKDFDWVSGKLPGYQINPGSSTHDEQMWLVSASSDREPGETYLFDRRKKKLTLEYRVREKLPREALASVESIVYKSSDGLEIPAYLTLPKGVAHKNLAVIVLPHGGPWGRDVWGYSGTPQFLANRGYAVLQPNFRASTGYGKKFLNAGNLEWGQKMQDDITWGAKHLIAEGIADPKRVAILGGSYGGYATLAGVAFTPDVYAAAVSIVGPSNLITLLDSIPPYWESVRTMFYRRMGDPKTPEGKAQLERQSPLNSAAKIKTPLMVVQGANDPRVNKAESDQIVIALRDRGFPVEYLVAPDEGHGFARPVNNLAMFAATEKFLAKYLGGRYQESMTPEVSARLKEITVDPKTVTLARKVDASAVGVPKAAFPLVSGTYKYAAKLEMGGQSVALGLSTSIKEDAGGGYSVTDTMTTPMGDAVDATILNKDLTVKQRSVKQGQVNIDVTVDGAGKVSGKMNAGGQERAVNADAGGPLFADAAGSGFSIAALPLAEGYSVTYRNFDLQKQKPKLMQAKVTGVEKVTVPAGSFEAFKVELTPADGGSDKVTVWVAKEPRKPVKVAAVIAQMGGATMTAELQP